VLLVVVGELEPNRPPVVTADTAPVVAGESRTIDVLANDTDPDNDSLVIVSVTQPEGSTGQAAVEGDRVRFVASPLTGDEPVTTRFTYVVDDRNGNQATGTVSVRILPEELPDPPFARDDTATTFVDKPVTLDVLRNDGDPSGRAPTLAGQPGCPSGGTATITPDSRITFTPPPGANGVFRCSYEVVSEGGRASAAIIVAVERPPVQNLPPLVPPQARDVVIGETITVNLLAGATDPEANPLRVLSSTAPLLGTAVRDGNILRYTAPSVTGYTSVRFQVADSNGGVTPGELLITIREPDPIAPRAVDDTRGVLRGSAPVQIDVLDNDIDDDTPNVELRVLERSRVSGSGTVTGTGRIVTLTPDPDFVGDLVASYVVVDPDGLRATGRVVLTVEVPPNVAPVAINDSVEIVNGSSATVPILLNDSDPNGDPLTVRLVSGANTELGTAQLRADGSVVFNAVPGEDGTAAVVYEISDGALTARATLSVRVLPCAFARPEAPNVVLATGYQQPIAIDLGAYARNGSIVEVGPPLSAPSGVVTPPAGENGVITFGYAVVNACRQRATGTVSIDVNQDPVAQPLAIALGRREERVVPVTDLATDAEPLRIVAVDGAPSWATVVDGTALRLAPAGAAAGAVSLTVTVEDPGGLRAAVPVSVDVINRTPVANADTVDVTSGDVTFSPLANDSDPDGDTIRLFAFPDSVVLSDGVTVAQFVQLPDGQVQVALAGGASGGGGSATIEYTIADDLDAVSAPATVTLRANRPPFARDVVATFEPGQTAAVALDAGDPDGDALTVTLVDVPADLVVSVSGLTLTVTVPAAPPQFAYEFRYTVTDAGGASATAEVDVVIVPTPPPTTTTTVPPPPPPDD
jgi:hypothetical protein